MERAGSPDGRVAQGQGRSWWEEGMECFSKEGFMGQWLFRSIKRGNFEKKVLCLVQLMSVVLNIWCQARASHHLGTCWKCPFGADPRLAVFQSVLDGVLMQVQV